MIIHQLWIYTTGNWIFTNVIHLKLICWLTLRAVSSQWQRLADRRAPQLVGAGDDRNAISFHRHHQRTSPKNPSAVHRPLVPKVTGSLRDPSLRISFRSSSWAYPNCDSVFPLNGLDCLPLHNFTSLSSAKQGQLDRVIECARRISFFNKICKQLKTLFENEPTERNLCLLGLTSFTFIIIISIALWLHWIGGGQSIWMLALGPAWKRSIEIQDGACLQARIVDLIDIDTHLRSLKAS